MLFSSVELFFLMYFIVIICVNKVLLFIARKKLNQKKNQDRTNSAFRASIFAGEEDKMLKLLENGADVKGTDVIGYASLHHAVLCGHYNLIKYLVEYGADIEQTGNYYGYKPIHLCVYPANKDRCLEELMKYGARLDAVDCLQNTLLHLVVKFRPQDVYFIEKLLTYGFDPNATNIIGNNCLHIIAASRTCSAKEALFLARKFIEGGVDINHKNKSMGETPLQMASRTGKTALVDLLLREGAAIDVLLFIARKKLNQKKNQDKTNSAFRASIFAGEEDKMLKLLENGADVKCTDVIGYASLHHAVLCGHYNLIKYLVEYGADIEQTGNYYGYKPIHLCVYPANKDRCLEELMKYGARLDAVDCLQNTLLHLVVKFRPQDVYFIEKLLTYGFDPNATNIIGNNCLHIIAASRTCSAKEALFLARKFIEGGVDINHKNKSMGETPLQMASRTGKTALVDLLLREGAAIDVRSIIGLNAFEQLFVEDHPMTDVITAFIKHIVLKKHRGESIEDSIFRKIASDVNLRIIYRFYDEDLNSLKSIEIIGTHWVTLHHILCSKNREVINYLRSVNIRDNIFSQKVSTFYWKEIKHKFSKIMQIVKFQEEACEILNLVFESRIPYLCLEQIAKYLSEEDVKKLSALLINENIN